MGEVLGSVEMGEVWICGSCLDLLIIERRERLCGCDLGVVRWF